MKDKIGRRSFMTRSLSGFGVLAFNGHRSIAFTATNRGRPKLLATTDYYDNILGCNCFFDRARLDELHKYLASMGVTRHQWMFDTIWDLYNDSTQGFDILAEAVKSAHAHGIELYTIIKPFEGGGFGDTFPHSLPFPRETNALRDMRGIYPFARPFVANNPHLCLKRRPGTYEISGTVAAINLVRSDDQPTQLRRANFTLFTSSNNCDFSEYSGPITFRESVEWRPSFPVSKPCRILHLEGLQFPEGHSYFLIYCKGGDVNENFGNERGSLIEVISSRKERLPFLVGTGTVQYAAHQSTYFDSDLYKQLVPYFRHPEVLRELQSEDKMTDHYKSFCSFGEHRSHESFYSLSKTGYVAIALGKPEYLLGNLHPIYPEVRQHWLEMVKYCLDRGVDGINFRHSNHTRSPEVSEYGFNDPVLEKAQGKTDFLTISRINGDSYTQFLREACALIKSRGKGITIHLYSQLLRADDRSGQIGYIPANFEWQWETWIKEIADDLEFRGAWTLRPAHLREVVEAFGRVTKDASKPFYFQGNMKELTFTGPYHFTGEEINWVLDHPFLSGFVLYETALFTKQGTKGELVGSPYLKEMIKDKFY